MWSFYQVGKWQPGENSQSSRTVQVPAQWHVGTITTWTLRIWKPETVQYLIYSSLNLKIPWTPVSMVSKYFWSKQRTRLLSEAFCHQQASLSAIFLDTKINNTIKPGTNWAAENSACLWKDGQVRLALINEHQEASYLCIWALFSQDLLHLRLFLPAYTILMCVVSLLCIHYSSYLLLSLQNHFISSYRIRKYSLKSKSQLGMVAHGETVRTASSNPTWVIK